MLLDLSTCLVADCILLGPGSSPTLRNTGAVTGPAADSSRRLAPLGAPTLGAPAATHQVRACRRDREPRLFPAGTPPEPSAAAGSKAAGHRPAGLLPQGHRQPVRGRGQLLQSAGCRQVPHCRMLPLLPALSKRTRWSSALPPPNKSADALAALPAMQALATCQSRLSAVYHLSPVTLGPIRSRIPAAIHVTLPSRPDQGRPS